MGRPATTRAIDAAPGEVLEIRTSLGAVHIAVTDGSVECSLDRIQGAFGPSSDQIFALTRTRPEAVEHYHPKDGGAVDDIVRHRHPYPQPAHRHKLAGLGAMQELL